MLEQITTEQHQAIACPALFFALPFVVDVCLMTSELEELESYLPFLQPESVAMYESQS